MSEQSTSPTPHVAALQRAVTIAETQSELARRMSAFLGRPNEKKPAVSQQTISYWLTKETLLETEWWPAIEYATGGQVTAADLRPDVFRQTQHGDAPAPSANTALPVADHAA